MKDNKGFTLVELLAVIVILAIIMIIAAPSMTKEIARNEAENKNILNQKIENAAHIYAAKYYVNELIELPNSTNDNTITFTLNDLQRDGLINLKDNCFDYLDEEITIKYENSKINYNYDNIESNTCYN